MIGNCFVIGVPRDVTGGLLLEELKKMEVEGILDFILIEKKDNFGLVYKYIQLQLSSKEQVDKLLKCRGFKINGQSILVVPDIKDVIKHFSFNIY